jgi:putative nucleotidyltransferase with HDIG domain
MWYIAPRAAGCVMSEDSCTPGPGWNAGSGRVREYSRVKERAIQIAKPNLLVVDDEAGVSQFLVEALRPLAARVEAVGDAQAALERIDGGDIDVVVCDVNLPRATGLELLSVARGEHWDLAFVLITGRPEVQQILEALRLEAFDFLLKPFTMDALTAAVDRSYQRLVTQRQARQYRSLLETSVERRTQDLEAALRQLETNHLATLEALVAALDAREHETYAHSFRVRAYTSYLARLAGYPASMVRHLEAAALLHDIGKVAVADSILLKPAKLTEAEWVEMKKHVLAGERILQRVPMLRPAAAIVRQHHERYDGRGYPDGRRGEEIALGARIFVFADTLDAMTSDRPYRKAPGFEAVRSEVVRCSGAQFDPHLVEAFLQVPVETWKEMRAHVEKEYSAREGIEVYA